MSQQPANDDEDPLVQFVEDMVPFYTVAIYVVDRAPGGPEEGGWWFDFGERVDYPVDSIRPDHLLTVFYQHGHLDRGVAEVRACEYASSIQKVLDYTVNKDGRNRDISSVNCEGRYCAMVHPGFPPKHWPERKPHYE